MNNRNVRRNIITRKANESCIVRLCEEAKKNKNNKKTFVFHGGVERNNWMAGSKLKNNNFYNLNRMKMCGRMQKVGYNLGLFWNRQIDLISRDKEMLLEMLKKNIQS